MQSNALPQEAYIQDLPEDRKIHIASNESKTTK